MRVLYCIFSLMLIYWVNFRPPDHMTTSKIYLCVCVRACACVCRECLRSVILLSEDPQVACPYRDEAYACDCTLQEREIRAVRTLSFNSTQLHKSLHSCTALFSFLAICTKMPRLYQFYLASRFSYI